MCALNHSQSIACCTSGGGGIGDTSERKKKSTTHDTTMRIFFFGMEFHEFATAIYLLKHRPVTTFNSTLASTTDTVPMKVSDVYVWPVKSIKYQVPIASGNHP